MSYYNTTSLAGSELEAAKASAESEKELVRRFFEKRPGEAYTSWEVHAEMKMGVPKGNIGRTMTDLFNEGFLVQTGEKKPSGPYNKPCLLYRLAEQPAPEPERDWLHDLPKYQTGQLRMFK